MLRLGTENIHVIAVFVFCIGVIVQDTAFHPSSIFAGAFLVTILPHQVVRA